MMILEIAQPWLIVIIVVSGLVLIAGSFLLYNFVILPAYYKKKVRSLEGKYSYLNSRLIGTIAQYLNRIEIISRTNLLYHDKYEFFNRRYNSIYTNEDKYSESMIQQLNHLIKAKQFKNIKQTIDSAQSAIRSFEDKLNDLYNELYAVIKVEEDYRKKIDGLKEIYRHVKQTYYAESAELEMVAASFNKMFEKIDELFKKIDDLIESASYEEIDEIIPVLENVLNALGKALIELPTLCSLTKTVVTERIAQIQVKYKETEKMGIPLYHLSFKNLVEDWKKRLEVLVKKIINLQTAGVHTECDLIIAEINRVSKQLDDEIAAKSYFKDNYEDIDRKVKEAQNTFLKISSMLPSIEKIYLISPEQKEKIKELSVAVTNLGNSKRFLDGFVLSGTRQPFSLLKNQLDELKANYEVVAAGIEDFKNFIDSLKTTAEEAYKMIYVYYGRMKEMEKVLTDIGLEDLRASYQEKIDAVYDVLNYLYKKIQSKPIDVEEVANKVEQLKNISNALFEEIDEKSRHCGLAENLMVALNCMRNEQDVAQALDQLEGAFMKGEFESVYHQADSLYRSKHVTSHE